MPSNVVLSIRYFSLTLFLSLSRSLPLSGIQSDERMKTQKLTLNAFNFGTWFEENLMKHHQVAWLLTTVNKLDQNETSKCHLHNRNALYGIIYSCIYQNEIDYSIEVNALRSKKFTSFRRRHNVNTIHMSQQIFLGLLHTVSQHTKILE